MNTIYSYLDSAHSFFRKHPTPLPAPVLSASYFLYDKATNLAKRILTPAGLQIAESCLAAVSGGLLTTYCAAPLLPTKNPLLIGASLGTIGGIAALIGYSWFQENIKIPYLETKIDQIAEESQTKAREQKILIIKPSHDENKTFSNHAKLNFIRACAENHSVYLLRPISQIQLSAKIHLFDKHLFDRIVIMAHGSPSSISLTDDADWEIDSKLPLVPWIKDHIKPNGFMILDSCSTGFRGGNYNLAQDISGHCNTTVYASSKNVNALSGMSYTPDIVPSFHQWESFRHKNTTQIYTKGKLDPRSAEK